MLEYAFTRFEAQIEAIERCVALLEQIDYAQRLQIVLEAAVRFHALVERVLAGVAKGGVPEIVCKRDRLHQIFIEFQAARHRARDLRDLEAVRESRAKQVAFVIDEDLGLVFEAAERRRVNDTVAVALEFGAANRRRLVSAAPTRIVRTHRIGRKVSHFEQTRRAPRQWKTAGHRR